MDTAIKELLDRDAAALCWEEPEVPSQWNGPWPAVETADGEADGYAIRWQHRVRGRWAGDGRYRQLAHIIATHARTPGSRRIPPGSLDPAALCLRLGGNIRPPAVYRMLCDLTGAGLLELGRDGGYTLTDGGRE
jgi:hypothetical protein